jgi:hypothetical protein
MHLTAADNASPDAATAAFVAMLSDPVATARILDAVAERTGNPVFRSAAGQLRSQNTGGRPTKDDRLALDRMASLLADGSARTVEQAARFVARTMQGEKSTEAAVWRLAHKYRSAGKTP